MRLLPITLLVPRTGDTSASGGLPPPACVPPVCVSDVCFDEGHYSSAFQGSERRGWGRHHDLRVWNMVKEALKAGHSTQQGLHAEVIDCCRVSPARSLDSLVTQKTGCCVVAEEHFLAEGF